MTPDVGALSHSLPRTSPPPCGRPCRESIPACVIAGVVIVCDIDTFGGEPTAGSIDFDIAEYKSAHVFGEMVFDRHSPYATVSRPDAHLHYSRSLAKLSNNS